MSYAKITWTEKQINTVQMPGTKVQNAAMGTGLGAVAGGVAAFIIGGIGVVACGTGVGVPAGAGLIAIASTVGAGAGAVAGAATGDSAWTKYIVTEVPHTAPAYQSWHWISMISLGALLLCYSIYLIRNVRRR